MRRVVVAVILFALLASVISLSASAASQDVFYLHDGYALDNGASTAVTEHYLKLDSAQRYVWKSVAFSSGQSFLAGTWTVSVWMSISEEPTQYKIELGVVDQSGTFISSSSSFTPVIQSVSPTHYTVTMTAQRLDVGAGQSLAVAFLRQRQDGSSPTAAFIFFDSSDTASGLNSPGLVTAATTATTTQTTTAQQTTTTTTQPSTTSTTSTTLTTTATTTTQPLTTSTTSTTHTTTTTTQVGSTTGGGFAFVIIAIGAGIASALGGLAIAASGRPSSEVFAYGGYYYCRRHRVPVWDVQGSLWCPVEQRYLDP